MSFTCGRTHLIFSVVLVLIGIMVIVDGLSKGEAGLNLQIAVGILAIVYGIARYWFFRPRTP